MNRDQFDRIRGAIGCEADAVIPGCKHRKGSMDKLHVKVKDYHIKCGIPNNSTECVLALAIGEAIGANLHMVEVGLGSTSFWLHDKDYWLNLPPKAVEFMNAFDNGGNVEPFEFDIDLNDRKGPA